MFCGTVMLGHMRPMWMELSYTLPAVGAGVLLGGVIGFAANSLGKRKG